MSSNNSSISSRPIFATGRWPWRVGGGQSKRLVANREETDSIHMTVAGGDMHTTHAPAPAAAPTTNTNGPKPEVKKWAKVDLLNIGLRAGLFSPPVHQKDKRQPPIGPLHEDSHRGVNVKGEPSSKITNRLARLKLKKAHKPLADFKPFCRLAPEVRFKIWNFAAHAETRILELVLDPDHLTFQVSKPGQKVPGIMQANRESRREGMLVFEKRYINNHPKNPYMKSDERPWTWYNPHKDIIFFGKDTCIRTIVDFFNFQSKENYAKVAFTCAYEIGTCKGRCDFDISKDPDGENKNLCRWGYGIGGGGIGILGVLHGKDEEIAMNDMVPGAPGVKEVFFVVETKCMQFKAGSMPSNLTFHPPIQIGPAHDHLQSDIRQVRSGKGVMNCGENRWNRGNYPDFNFVSLAPPLKVRNGKVLKHDAIMIPARHTSGLIYPGSKFLSDLGQKTGVDIIPGELIYKNQVQIKIGLFNGTEEGIQKAKEEITKQPLADFNYARRDPNHRGAEGDGRGRGDEMPPWKYISR